MGKTGLISHTFGDRQIQREYHTFFIDILHTTGLREFTYFFGKEVFSVLKSKGGQMPDGLVSMLKSLQGKITVISRKCTTAILSSQAASNP